MRKIPEIYRNVMDSSITLTYSKPTNTLIWLHGLGDTAEGFLSFFTHSSSPLYQGSKVKLIQAPLRNISINNGQVYNSWYDIYTLKRFEGNQASIFDFTHIEESINIIDQHVKDQVQYWVKNDPKSKINPLHRIYIGGFSQGGVMSLHYGLQSSRILAGIIAMSSYLLRSTKLNNYGKIPVLAMHGENDSIIKQIEAKKSYQRILDSPIVEYHLLNDLDHTVDLSQFQILQNWLGSTHRYINQHYSRDTQIKVAS